MCLNLLLVLGPTPTRSRQCIDLNPNAQPTHQNDLMLETLNLISADSYNLFIHRRAITKYMERNQ